ncbi:MAG TPA: GTP cyclohydrolase II [Ktedonobacteraceae bacterium]|nr:GTP cyclohydrolase II [Ktedonobacteraceae bacterium]
MYTPIRLISEVQLPTALALFRLRHYEESETGQAYLALLLGDLQASADQPPLVRLHSACATGDIFGSLRCDCQAQMHAALRAIAGEGRGLLLYLPQEGRGIGLTGKLQAYELQEQGYDTVEANEHLGYPADARDYTATIAILQEMQLTRMRLMTNNPAKIEALRASGLHIERVSLEIPPTERNRFYLQTKHRRLGHLLDMAFEYGAVEKQSSH